MDAELRMYLIHLIAGVTLSCVLSILILFVAMWKRK